MWSLSTTTSSYTQCAPLRHVGVARGRPLCGSAHNQASACSPTLPVLGSSSTTEICCLMLSSGSSRLRSKSLKVLANSRTCTHTCKQYDSGTALHWQCAWVLEHDCEMSTAAHPATACCLQVPGDCNGGHNVKAHRPCSSCMQLYKEAKPVQAMQSLKHATHAVSEAQKQPACKLA